MMDEDRAEFPDFWGVWTQGFEQPELFLLESDAARRAYDLAQSNVGIKVHVLKMVSAGTVNYPNQPSVTGILARKILPSKGAK
jgi:hypothetical protein